MNSKRENGAVLFAICPARSLGLLLSGTLGDRAEKVKAWRVPPTNLTRGKWFFHRVVYP